LYNGEKTAITQRIEIGGVLVAKVTLKPASCDTFRVTIPRVAYKSTRAKVDIVRESGPFACLASTVKVYEKTERQNGDGELAGSVGQLQRGVVATPNPFPADASSDSKLDWPRAQPPAYMMRAGASSADSHCSARRREAASPLGTALTNVDVRRLRESTTAALPVRDTPHLRRSSNAS
jgi:hypothetical protein